MYFAKVRNEATFQNMNGEARKWLDMTEIKLSPNHNLKFLKSFYRNNRYKNMHRYLNITISRQDSFIF
jgi:hypothetical protein